MDLAGWPAHFLERLERQIALTGDGWLVARGTVVPAGRLIELTVDPVGAVAYVSPRLLGWLKLLHHKPACFVPQAR